MTQCDFVNGYLHKQCAVHNVYLLVSMPDEAVSIFCCQTLDRDRHCDRQRASSSLGINIVVPVTMAMKPDS